MDTKSKKEELQELSKFVIFSMNSENFQKLHSQLYKNDFIIVNENDSSVDKQIKKLIKKIGILKDNKKTGDSEFYQLFYYFTISFKTDEISEITNKNKEYKIRIILLNSEIGKLIEILKNFVLDVGAFVEKDVVKKIKEFTFVNNVFTEDYKILDYKYNILKVFNKFGVTNKLSYKSSKYEFNSSISPFSILSNEEYEKKKINNSKVNVVGNFMFMLKDLNIVKDFY